MDWLLEEREPSARWGRETVLEQATRSWVETRLAVMVLQRRASGMEMLLVLVWMV
jgi:hypothetical protein